MIEIYVPALREYNTAMASQLVTDLAHLRNLDEIAEWDNKAMAEVENIRAALRTVDSKQQELLQALEYEKREHEAKSFLVRLFAGRQERKRLLVAQSQLAKEKTQIEGLLDQVEAAIDFTPNSPDDLKELIKECKQRKKELLTEKKAINAQMASIRVEARQKTVDTIPGKYGTWDRRQIRLDKESALQPHETEKAAIERQIIRLDRGIIWLERFKSNND